MEISDLCKGGDENEKPLLLAFIHERIKMKKGLFVEKRYPVC
jgi:hypothetical protein